MEIIAGFKIRNVRWHTGHSVCYCGTELDLVTSSRFYIQPRRRSST